jgi:hypothetical protein
MKGILKFVTALRAVVKYAGLILIVVDIIGYAADKIEGYVTKKDQAKNEENSIQ